MVFFSVKAYLLSKVTVLREGMSIYEDRVIDNTLQSNDARIAECTTTVIHFSSE